MLKINRSFTLPDFSLKHSSKTMTFSPVTVDDDELLRSAHQAYIDEHDNNWQLTERPDVEELQRYWQMVASGTSDEPR